MGRFLCEHNHMDEVHSLVDARCRMEAHGERLAKGGGRDGQCAVQLGQGSDCKSEL